MDELKDYINKTSEFLRIQPGETVTCEYLGFKVVPSRFDTEAETVQYKLRVGEYEKKYESRGVGLAEQFLKVKEGEMVQITREGEGTKTKYKVVPLEKPKDEISEEDINKIVKKTKKVEAG